MEHLSWAQAQAIALSLIMATFLALPDFDSTFLAPLPRQLGQNFALGCIGEFVYVTTALAPLAPTLTSLKMVRNLLVLHPSDIDSPCSDSLLNFQPNANLELSMDSFRLVFFAHLLHHSGEWAIHNRKVILQIF
jgi:hypothetical protein